MTAFLKKWMNVSQPLDDCAELVVLTEQPAARKAIEKTLDLVVKDHFADLDIIHRIGGYRKSLAYVRNKLPTKKKVRSGDFGELMTSEYIDQYTEYSVPIKKLRWKDDRNTTLRGNDVLAIQRLTRGSKILKAESKSRLSLNNVTVTEALEGLDGDGGRPNPSSLAFISSRLRELGRDDEAEAFEKLQQRLMPPSKVRHLLFTLSGNAPLNFLSKAIVDSSHPYKRDIVGCVIEDHQEFIADVFDRNYGRRSK
ncbi:Hachiman antiphage defense system protein HamA [Rhodopirellula sallentina]|uniref:Anti-bacteriophage protein A/HamA C-terminal domain-containing protein n=1 Tax=Rhodopirellula sallentina SM41 TaxID=1263870 RepID=M5UB68_9BACT|nr:Hachiman antiphage defense system protein HamA [Rhodopirellula sallentina]EMI55096.1 hypothetical protein RSSM_03420 [Rhodopirellula sallentina SM41]